MVRSMDCRLSRREVLAAAAGGITAMSLGQNMPKVRPVLGSGAHTYECIHDWLQAPADMLFGDCHGLAQDSQGRIYLAHTVRAGSVNTNAICVYDPDGAYITSWGSQFAGGAHGLDLREEDGTEFLYHCDVNKRLIAKTTLDGEVLWTKQAPIESGVYAAPNEWSPTNIAFDPNGDIFVGDGYGKGYMHRFDADGSWKAIVCQPGTEPGRLRQPHGQWVDTRHGHPKLCVCDRGNRRLQYFTLNGTLLGESKEGIRLPCHIHYNDQGEALIPDLDSVITVLDKDDKPIAHLGDGAPSNLRGKPRSEYISGKFIHPHAAIWLQGGDILVAEWVPDGRVTLLKRK